MVGRRRKDGNPLGLEKRVYWHHGQFRYRHATGAWEDLGTDVDAANERARALNNPASYGTITYWLRQYIAAAKAGKNITVMMGYADRLERTTAWWVQLWSESLGKDGVGTTPVRALGPVDQHSQLQLHLGGPKDKLFNVVTVDFAGKGPKLDKTLAERAGEPVFADRRVGDRVRQPGA